MTHGSLYSGIGGWLLAARWAGIDNIFTCEIDKFCNKVLDKHFPNTDRHHDIKEADFKKYRGTIDIISTSDPCQPFSFAGKRGGKADDRYLWPETIRVIREIKPSYVVFENVPGFISLGFETVASDLEAEGYAVESFIIPACAIGAWHRRDRLWIIAHTRCESEGCEIESKQSSNNITGCSCSKNTGGESNRNEDVSNTEVQGLEGENTKGGTCPDGWNMQQPWSDWWTTEPNVGRVAHGIPSRVDRLKSLGNSIVPQIAYIIFEAIKKNPQNIWKSQK
jgi:DNA (cytosine-5)-methyltransferase 1